MLLREGMGSGKLREPLVRSRCDRAGAAPRLSASSARVLERGHWRASAAAAEAICAAGKGAAERPGATHGTAPFPVSWGTHGCRLARGPSRSPGRRKISSGNPQVSENSRGPTFGRFSDRDPHLGQIRRGPQDVARSPGTPGCRAGTPGRYSTLAYAVRCARKRAPPQGRRAKRWRRHGGWVEALQQLQLQLLQCWAECSAGGRWP